MVETIQHLTKDYRSSQRIGKNMSERYLRLIEVLSLKEKLLNEAVDFLKSKGLWEEFLSISSVEIVTSKSVVNEPNT